MWTVSWFIILPEKLKSLCEEITSAQKSSLKRKDPTYPSFLPSISSFNCWLVLRLKVGFGGVKVVVFLKC